MSGGAILALVTDAYGGRGGIAQYNRDFAAALAETPGIGRIDLLPRLRPCPAGPTPGKVTQHKARAGRATYGLVATWLAVRTRPRWIICGHLYMAPLAWLLARAAGAVLIVQTHGIETWKQPGLLTRWAVERADLVLAVSRDTRARVLRWAGIAPERVRVVGNTVEDLFSPGEPAAARARLGLGRRFVLLTVGRLAAAEKYKGHERVFGELARLGAEGLDPLYLIAGEGDDRPRLERLAESVGVADRVRFLGHVPRDTLPDLYRAADLFILPSSGEGFGIVLLEAMACGAPAAALQAGGAPDPMADGGLGALLSERSFGAEFQALCRQRKAGRLASGEPLAAEARRRFGRPAFARRVQRCFEQLEPAA